MRVCPSAGFILQVQLRGRFLSRRLESDLSELTFEDRWDVHQKHRENAPCNLAKPSPVESINFQIAGKMGKGNETGNQTESPWPEAVRCESMMLMGDSWRFNMRYWRYQVGDLQLFDSALRCQDYKPEIFVLNESKRTKTALPFIHYNGCTMAIRGIGML